MQRLSTRFDDNPAINLGLPIKLNFNILLSSEGMTELQKPLFSHDFLKNSSLDFVLKEQRKFREKYY